MKTEEIIARLYSRHPMFQGKWACLVEFQRIDFLAVGTWPSTKFVVHGYEIKASRSDWLREVKDPDKSFEGRRKVDHWWLACPPGVVQPGELPEGWGHIEVTETECRVVVPAPALRPALMRKAAPDTNWYDRAAFAGMARRAVYAEADRGALMALGDTMDLDPALAMSAIRTGRKTPFQREMQAAFRKRKTNGSAKRKRRKTKATAMRSQEYVGW